jgi:hypothetical protein
LAAELLFDIVAPRVGALDAFVPNSRDGDAGAGD